MALLGDRGIAGLVLLLVGLALGWQLWSIRPSRCRLHRPTGEWVRVVLTDRSLLTVSSSGSTDLSYAALVRIEVRAGLVMLRMSSGGSVGFLETELPPGAIDLLRRHIEWDQGGRR